MPTLENATPGTTFKDMLNVYDGDLNEGLETSLKTVQDGEGVSSALQLSTTVLNVSTHNGSNQGLALNGTTVTATGTELNHVCDGRTVGGGGATDIVDTQSSQSVDNKTIDGGGFS